MIHMYELFNIFLKRLLVFEIIDKFSDSLQRFASKLFTPVKLPKHKIKGNHTIAALAYFNHDPFS